MYATTTSSNQHMSIDTTLLRQITFKSFPDDRLMAMGASLQQMGGFASYKLYNVGEIEAGYHARFDGDWETSNKSIVVLRFDTTEQRDAFVQANSDAEPLDGDVIVYLTDEETPGDD